MLLQPSNSFEDYCSFLKLNIDDTQPLKYYICSKSRFRCDYSDVLSTSKTCIHCSIGKTPVVSLGKQFCKGFVNDGETFFITDDLKVFPESVPRSAMLQLWFFGSNHSNSIKEMTVNVTKEKVLDLLKCSLVSKSTLTDMFLRMKLTDRCLPRSFRVDVENENINDKKITVKLVIRKSDGKILYAEGERDFADFLLSFLTLPLGGVVGMFEGTLLLGSIQSMYLWMQFLDLEENKYFVTKEAENRIVDPHLAPQFKLKDQILPIRQPRSRFYCHNGYYITCENGYYFDNIPDTKTVYVERNCECFVKGARTYVATDDLVVTESSPTTVLNLINHFQTSVDDLKEKVINIGVHECLSILKASLTSTSALTNGLGHLLTEVQEGKMRSINIC
ncbi:hypothetical protein P8452_59878 [Trifolium repens]|nr:hypothetical protein P8452_59878 [Trifolium repens]